MSWCFSEPLAGPIIPHAGGTGTGAGLPNPIVLQRGVGWAGMACTLPHSPHGAVGTTVLWSRRAMSVVLYSSRPHCRPRLCHQQRWL